MKKEVMYHPSRYLEISKTTTTEKQKEKLVFL